GCRPATPPRSWATLSQHRAHHPAAADVHPPACYHSCMTTVSPQELQRDTDALLHRVQAGERLVVVRGGRPVAELWPVGTTRPAPRPFGLCAGEFAVPDDFDAPLPDDVLREFEGR